MALQTYFGPRAVPMLSSFVSSLSSEACVRRVSVVPIGYHRMRNKRLCETDARGHLRALESVIPIAITTT